MRRASRLKLFMAALLGAVVLAAGATDAHAAGFANGYCGVLINQGTWCGDGSDHSYDYNRAAYNGSGSVFVCERLLYANTATERTPPSCAYNYAPHNYGATSTMFEAEVTHLYSGGARHTISGYATA